MTSSRLPGSLSRTTITSLLVLIVALVTAGTTLAVRRHERSQEWAHGGDNVNVHAVIASATASAVSTAIRSVGGGDPNYVVVSSGQGFVVKVAWTGTRHAGGAYEFMLFDKRLDPARPLEAEAGWQGQRAVGPDWAGAYEALSRHYPWLAATAARHADDGDVIDVTNGLGLHAVRRGSGALVFDAAKDAIPTSHPATDLELAMFFVGEDGQVRWARKVPLTATG
ncbi:MAG TPA: hypothetical protein VFE15_05095 [Marmoricola sp.]|jgi:hypothetical protein|nr:hypothetical protein [Marmoricola sp.]